MVIVWLAAVALLWTAPASATTIDALLFEELVLGADFVGVVECEQAGGIVAEYKIVESWKGPKAGGKVSIRVAVNYWEPQFPIALCGQRYLVTAYKEAPSRVISTTSGEGVPLWWRNIPADYRLPLFQGRWLLAPGADRSPEFAKTRKEVQSLLALKPAEQEAALLKAVVDNDFFGKKWRGGEPDEVKAKDLHARFTKLTSAEAVVGELLRLVKEDSKKWAVRARIVLEKGGGAAALEQLQKLPADQSPWEKKDVGDLIETVKRRQRMKGAEPPTKARPPDKEEPPAEARLRELRKALAEGQEGEGFGSAFETLTRYDPGPVAEYLIAWKPTEKTGRDSDQGYMLGSYFAWRCGKERTKQLKVLLGARDPFIRVAGAVYLCFEDAEGGKAELKKLTTLEGDPGVWAALTLARRGQKDAVPRALEVFRELTKEQEEKHFGMAGVPHNNLQKRVLILLSNSARAGGVPQPSLPEKDGKPLDSLLQWWKQHGEKATLQDPWSELLGKQKLD